MTEPAVTIASSAATRRKTVAELAAALDSATVLGPSGAIVTGIEYDSRLIHPGSLFAALVGADLDGHAYIGSAIRAGASALLAERASDAPIPQIVVPDSRAALAQAAAAFYDHPSRELACIGITGTDGKTTTTHIAEAIFRHAGVRTGLIGTVGTRIGDGRQVELPHQTTPESNLLQRWLREMVDAGTGIALVEATSHGLAMHRLDATRFAVAGVTNITREHLEYHGTIEAYRRAKAILLERVAAERGVVVLNADDPGAMAIRDFADGADVVTYTMAGRAADIVASDVVVRNDGSRFSLCVEGRQHQVSVPLIGEFNVANALCAIGVARAAGVSLETCVAAVAETPAIPGRMEPVVAGQPFDVVVDYAHTPESIARILTLLRGSGIAGKLVIVTGSAGERDTGKRPLQGRISAELADVSIFTNEDPRNEDPERILADIAVGATEAGGVEGRTFHLIADRRNAISRAFDIAQPGDCVLLAGKGHERSIIVGRDHMPWDEAAVARDLLAERGFTTAEER